MAGLSACLEAIEQLVQRFAAMAHERHEHVVHIACDGCVAEGSAVEGTEGDVAFLGGQKLFDGRPRCRGRGL